MAEHAPVAAMTPVEILEAADTLLGTKRNTRAHGWPRVVAVLGRHAIEEALQQYWIPARAGAGALQRARATAVPRRLP